MSVKPVPIHREIKMENALGLTNATDKRDDINPLNFKRLIKIIDLKLEARKLTHHIS